MSEAGDADGERLMHVRLGYVGWPKNPEVQFSGWAMSNRNFCVAPPDNFDAHWYKITGLEKNQIYFLF